MSRPAFAPLPAQPEDPRLTRLAELRARHRVAEDAAAGLYDEVIAAIVAAWPVGSNVVWCRQGKYCDGTVVAHHFWRETIQVKNRKTGTRPRIRIADLVGAGSVPS